MVQFGGQTAIKLTESLMKMGVPILGTKAEDVDAAEDRELFDKILEETEIPRAAGGTVFTAEEAKEVANRLGYPVLVRPSYVLGGQGMQIALNDEAVSYTHLCALWKDKTDPFFRSMQRSDQAISYCNTGPCLFWTKGCTAVSSDPPDGQRSEF